MAPSSCLRCWAISSIHSAWGCIGAPCPRVTMDHQSDWVPSALQRGRSWQEDLEMPLIRSARDCKSPPMALHLFLPWQPVEPEGVDLRQDLSARRLNLEQLYGSRCWLPLCWFPSGCFRSASHCIRALLTGSISAHVLLAITPSSWHCFSRIEQHKVRRT